MGEGGIRRTQDAGRTTQGKLEGEKGRVGEGEKEGHKTQGAGRTTQGKPEGEKGGIRRTQDAGRTTQGKLEGEKGRVGEGEKEKSRLKKEGVFIWFPSSESLPRYSVGLGVGKKDARRRTQDSRKNLKG
jgi:hypothetical protein